MHRAGGRKVRVPAPAPTPGSSLAAPGRWGFRPRSVAARASARPRSLLPGVRAREERAGRRPHPEGRPRRVHTLPARRPAAEPRWLGSPPRRDTLGPPPAYFFAEGGNAEVCSLRGQMRRASRSACAPRAVPRVPASPPVAPLEPEGRPARAPWPRCRARSAARSCSRSTGKRRPAERGRTLTRPAGGRRRGRSWGPANPGPRCPLRGAPETAPETPERRAPRRCGGHLSAHWPARRAQPAPLL